MSWSLVVVGFVLLNGLVHGMTSRSGRSGRPGPDTKLIYIGGLFPNVSALFPSVESAIRDVNNYPSILPNYQLQFIFSETAACDVTRGFQKYLDFVDILPRKLLLLNGLCTETIREIDLNSRNSGGNARTLQVSYANSDPTFERTLLPSLFRLLPAETTFNFPRTILVQEILSKSPAPNPGIGLMYQNSPKYFISHEEQVTLLLKQNIGGIESEGFEEGASVDELRAILRRLKEKNVNIILGNFNATRAVQVLCLAYKEKMFGEKYTWLLAGDFESNWWRSDVENEECFPHEMERVMDGMIRIDILPFHGNSLDMKFPEHRSFHQNTRNSKFDGYVYDAIWAMAYGLQNISHFYSKLSQNAPLNPKDDYLSNTTISFQNPIWEEALQHSLAAVSFLGVTGRVSFDAKQGRVGYSLLIKQFQSLGSGYDEVNVGEYDSVSNKLNFVKYPHRMIRRRAQVLSSKSDFEEQSPRPHNQQSTEYEDHPAGIIGSTSNILKHHSPVVSSVLIHLLIVALQ